MHSMSNIALPHCETVYLSSFFLHLIQPRLSSLPQPITTAALLPARLQHILTPGFYYGNFSHSYLSGLSLSLWAHLYHSPTVTVPYLQEVQFLQLHQLVSDYWPELRLDLPFVKFPSMFCSVSSHFFHWFHCSFDFLCHCPHAQNSLTAYKERPFFHSTITCRLSYYLIPQGTSKRSRHLTSLIALS